MDINQSLPGLIAFLLAALIKSRSTASDLRKLSGVIAFVLVVLGALSADIASGSAVNLGAEVAKVAVPVAVAVGAHSTLKNVWQFVKGVLPVVVSIFAKK